MAVPRTRRPLLTTTLILTAASLLPIVDACYNSTGGYVPGFAPCRNHPTICCYANRSRNPRVVVTDGTSDECLPNGLCATIYVDSDGNNATNYWRGHCITKEEGACPSVCMTEPGNAIGMTPCSGAIDSRRWCCIKSRLCCDPNSSIDAEIIAPTWTPLPVQQTLNVPAPTMTSNNTQVIGSLRGVLNTKSAGELSAAAKAGIGIGAAAGGISLLALGFLLARWNLIRAHWSQSASGDASSIGDSEASLKKAPSAELDESNVFHEMQSNEDRRELYGDGGHHEMQGGDGCLELPHDNVRHEMQG
ncbi:hypothetical protein BU24DRAFT_451745 [Aaosphaeria arxii CBS 175.79]|uniref:Mid2 domain-containing protein n=1 Tax=Aaosphaeria arxii CBS 175.79 TaxID=1450172 RepID=A0A6A5XPW6_9PLEO|nr:uncharacterized protein BU24DRAFT_451745 [Aaosphaeria arxii CBS 175.79]KAF2014801.1 hypothetical protein BU24DRAFT_451745 [Aaosphaeria arxii CBS 175.79]